MDRWYLSHLHSGCALGHAVQWCALPWHRRILSPCLEMQKINKIKHICSFSFLIKAKSQALCSRLSGPLIAHNNPLAPPFPNGLSEVFLDRHEVLRFERENPQKWLGTVVPLGGT